MSNGARHTHAAPPASPLSPPDPANYMCRRRTPANEATHRSPIPLVLDASVIGIFAPGISDRHHTGGGIPGRHTALMRQLDRSELAKGDQPRETTRPVVSSVHPTGQRP